MTGPGEHAALFDGLPASLPRLVAVVQGMLLHMHWAEAYGVTLTDERKHEASIRPVDEIVGQLLALDNSALDTARPLEKRVVSTCRDYATLLCGMLRHQGVPARARCGFGAYFLSDRYEDHWICEYWNTGLARWAMVDAQLDAFQRDALGIAFDPLDVPPDQFILAGQAWQMCRAGQADPQKFGIFEWHGLWFVRGNLVRDFLSLNKIEILPWDGGWGYLAHWEDEADPQHPPDSMAAPLMDRVAELTLTVDDTLDELQAMYAADDGFHVPAEWDSDESNEGRD
jgi:hypothetical protein